MTGSELHFYYLLFILSSMNRDDIAGMRRSYTLAGFSERDAHASPFVQFRLWFEEAKAAQILEPNAMTLATVSPSGTPEARIVLLKDMDERGFVFYTNYESAKAESIAANPRVALLFFWGELERQVRITGSIEKVSREESDAYFQMRPRESRIGAWASKQSSVIESREALEKRFAELTADFEGKEIPLPPFWGGYRVVAESLEFWQGRVGRLHDRVRYQRTASGWKIARLSP